MDQWYDKNYEDRPESSLDIATLIITMSGALDISINLKNLILTTITMNTDLSYYREL